MNDPSDPVATLRERVEIQERELEAAVRELAAAARHSVARSSWIREHAWMSMLGAAALGVLIARLLRGDR